MLHPDPLLTGSSPIRPLFLHYLIWVNYKVVSQLSQPIFLSFSYLNSTRHNLVIELCLALKYIINFFLQLFSKPTYSFVAIELLDLFKNAKFHFYCSRELSVFGFKEKYSLSKNYWFFCFMFIKRSFKTKGICTNINNNESIQWKTTCTFLYIQKTKISAKRFYILYKKLDSLQKARQFALHFYSQKARHFTLRDFHEIF